MNFADEVMLVLAAGFLLANLPFINERVFVLGPRRSPKHPAWRLLELAVGAALTLGLGLALEASLGQRHPQDWPFYVAFACLFLTFAFPGFVWRHLRRRPAPAASDDHG